MPGLAGYIKSKFEDAENGRRTHEQRWLQAYKNFRGVYDSTTQYRDSERSKVFIKITKTKVLAAYGQIIDILFANKKFPIVVESTPVPRNIVEFAHLKTPLDDMNSADPYGYAGDGRELAPGATTASLGPTTPQQMQCPVGQKWANLKLVLRQKRHEYLKSIFKTSYLIQMLSICYEMRYLSLRC